MKFRFIVLVFLSISIFLGSCIPSIYPIYSADKLVEVKELPGTWTDQPSMTDNGSRKDLLENQEDFELTTTNEQGQPETWEFNKQDDKSYLLVHTDGEGNPGAFEVHIVKLGQYLFMDFYPTKLPDESKRLFNVLANENTNSMMAWHQLPVHTFAKLEIGDERLKISMFDPDFLENLLENKQLRIKHEVTEEGYVLTASTSDLQKFAEKYAENENAFLDEPIELKIKI